MVDIKNKENELINYFKTNKNIIAVWIIGSYGTEYFTEDSDIDFAILFDIKIQLMDEMAVACDISDIIEYEDVDIVNLKNAPITLQLKTLKEGKSMYEKDYIRVCDYMEQVFNIYRDEKYYIDSFRKDYYDSYLEERIL